MLLTNKSPFPPNDGSSFAMASMVYGFIASDWELSVFALNTRKHRKSADDVPDEVRDRFRLQLFEVDNRPTVAGAISNLLFSRQSYAVSRFFYRELAEAIQQELREHRYDVVQVEGLSMAVYLPTIRAAFQGSIVYRAHNIENRIWLRAAKNESNLLKRIYVQLQAKRLKSFEKSILKEFSAIVPITHIDAEVLSSYAPGVPMRTAYTGLKIAGNALVEMPENADFFFVGAFDWLPNLQGVNWFMEAVWPEIKKAIPKSTFHILGRHCPESISNAEGVVVHQDRPTASAFFAEHSILLVPLQSGSGLRIKIVEALAAGRPVVSTSVGEEGIAATEAEGLFVADEPRAFAEKAIELFRNAERRRAAGRGGRAFAEKHFDRDAIARDLTDFYGGL